MKMNQETKNPGEIETERALFRPIPVSWLPDSSFFCTKSLAALD